MIHNNQKSIDYLLDLGTINVMLDQIQTGWNPAISEIFLASGGMQDSSSLTKKDIKHLVD
jgi:hypothetical protein